MINEAFCEVVFETINKQLETNDPIETKETVARLINKGFSEEEAINLIANILMIEFNYMFKTDQDFNMRRYITYLKNLPELPAVSID
ncbi:MAG: hypothetical protein AB1782_16240 [Cyanobacteriota bacterium]